MVKVFIGDLLESKARTLVNAVNRVVGPTLARSFCRLSAPVEVHGPLGTACAELQGA